MQWLCTQPRNCCNAKHRDALCYSVMVLAGLLVVELRGSYGPPEADCLPSHSGRGSKQEHQAVSWGCYPSASAVTELLKDLDHRGASSLICSCQAWLALGGDTAVCLARCPWM